MLCPTDMEPTSQDGMRMSALARPGRSRSADGCRDPTASLKDRGAGGRVSPPLFIDAVWFSRSGRYRVRRSADPGHGATTPGRWREGAGYRSTWSDGASGERGVPKRSPHKRSLNPKETTYRQPALPKLGRERRSASTSLDGRLIWLTSSFRRAPRNYPIINGIEKPGRRRGGPKAGAHRIREEARGWRALPSDPPTSLFGAPSPGSRRGV